MRRTALPVIFTTVLFLGSAGANAQSLPLLDKEDNQSWNDLQVTVPMTKHFDLTTRITMRFGKNVSRLNDGRYLLGFVWKPTPSLSFSPYFWYIRARNATGRFRTENRLSLAVTYKLPFKVVGLTHRSIFEYRERRPISTWRYRAYLTAEKELPEKLIPKAKFYIGDEVFYDSATDRFSRNRFAIGILKTINKQWTLDIYYMRQNDGFSRPGDLNTIWTAWRLRL